MQPSASRTSHSAIFPPHTTGAMRLPAAGGVVLDRFGVRRVGRIEHPLWSMASFAAAARRRALAAFFGARLLVGVGEAPTFPANAKAIGVGFRRRNAAWRRRFRCSGEVCFRDWRAPWDSAVACGLALELCGDRCHQLSVFTAFFWVIYRDPEDDAELSELRSSVIAEDTENEPGPADGPALRSALCCGSARSLGWRSALVPITTSFICC